MAGRPSGTALVPDSTPEIGEEVCTVDTRGRLLIPSWIANGVAWLGGSPKRTTHSALAVCSSRGAIRLLEWDSNAESVLQRRKDLLERHDLDSVLLLEYRYRRILIPKDLRISLGAPGTAHLGLDPESAASVYVGFKGDCVSIITQAFRDREIADAEGGGLFAELP